MKTTALLYAPIFLMGSALIVDLAVAAEKQQQKQQQNRPVAKATNSQPTLDTNKGENINSNKTAGPKTNDGVSGGHTEVRTVPGGSATTSGTYKAPQQAGTPAAPGGALFDPKSARPGNAAPGSEGKAVTPADFAKDKQIRELVNPKLTEGAPKAGNAITDQQNANPLGTISTTGPGRSGNPVSKGSAISDEPAPSVGAKPLGPPTEAAAKWKDAYDKQKDTPTPAAKVSAEPVEKPAASGGPTVEGTMAKILRPIVNEEEKFKSVPIYPAGVRGTPNPESDTGGHGMKNMVGTDKEKKSPSVIEAERKRQVTLPNDTGAPPAKVHMDNAAQQNVTARQSNLINPERGDGTTGGGRAIIGAPPPAAPGVSSGRPANPSGSGVRPLCTADNPTC